jgi:sugar O-acyltransferase (sialic acid O-acetyltransferase NeuD family)
MAQRIAIFGAGGFGREVLQLIQDINAQADTWNCAGFLVDRGSSGPAEVAGLPVLGDIEWLAAHPDVQVVVAVGSSAARRRIVERIRARCVNRFATLVHPRAWVGGRVQLGAGSIVCAGALLTTDIRIAQHVHVNIGCTIGHDAELADFVTLNPSVNVSGNVRIHEGSEVGTGSVIIPGQTVGSWAIVGAGTVVTREVPANVTAVGAPARVIKERAPGWQLQA